MQFFPAEAYHQGYAKLHPDQPLHRRPRHPQGL
ncbi:MAG: hypothetical protein U0894_02885 [Pirellulales bacterium]